MGLEQSWKSQEIEEGSDQEADESNKQVTVIYAHAQIKIEATRDEISCLPYRGHDTQVKQ